MPWSTISKKNDTCPQQKGSLEKILRIGIGVKVDSPKSIKLVWEMGTKFGRPLRGEESLFRKGFNLGKDGWKCFVQPSEC